ncbi:OmpA family protein [Photobacterium damselae]|uniref:OmpA family protein n=1 Tax=Photobacterium damselae TaxID=38293 RepID=UPI0040682273
MKFSTLTSALILCFSTGALAEGEEKSPLAGFWLSSAIGAGYSHEYADMGYNSPRQSGGILGYKIQLGYEFNSAVSAYMGYDLSHYSHPNAFSHVGEWGFRGREVIGEDVFLIGKAGAALVLGENNNNGFAGTVGVGLEINHSSRWSTIMGVDYYHQLELANNLEADRVQGYMGFLYRFGQPSTPEVIVTDAIIVSAPEEKQQDAMITKPSEKDATVIEVMQVQENFSNDSSFLQSPESLNTMIEQLKAVPSAQVEITGYTDNRGRAEYNLALSLKRAEAVARYFIDHGIESARIITFGKGEANPIASNQTQAGRAENRRVNVQVISAP